MAGSRVLLSSLLFIILFALSSTMSIGRQFEEMPLHRIARTPNTALLVPFPRIGKRSSNVYESSPDHFTHRPQKRLYFARVGKRYMYAARVGK